MPLPCRPPPVRRLLGAALTLLLLAEAGCSATPPQAGGADPQRLGRVAVVATARQPEIRLEGFARGKGSGAAAGAGNTFARCLEPLGQSHCSGDFCGAVLIVWFGVCGVAGLVGGVVGAVSAPGQASVRQAEERLHAAVYAGEIQQALRRQVEGLARSQGQELPEVAAASLQQAAQHGDYRPLAEAGIDSVLEVTLRRVSSAGQGIDAPLQLLMQAHVRLIASRDNRVLGSSDFLYQGERRRLAEWSANDAAELLRALQDGYSALGAQIYDSVFRLYPFPDRDMHSAGWLSGAFGLAPLAPRNDWQLSASSFPGRTLEWALVDSTQPTLRWQAFPRASDRAAAAAEMARVGDVRYDLVIAEERHLAPARVVYRSEGLAQPSHRLISPLAAKHYYFWSVRAHFKLDGRERVTEWSATRVPGRQQLSAPSSWSYRFRTP